MNALRPIETAPKDGKLIDLWVCREGFNPARFPDCRWSPPMNCWWYFHGWSPQADNGAPLRAIPTHWSERLPQQAEPSTTSGPQLTQLMRDDLRDKARFMRDLAYSGGWVNTVAFRNQIRVSAIAIEMALDVLEGRTKP